jgi:Zn-dependent protease
MSTVDRLSFSERELLDFGVAWVALSFAFALLLTGVGRAGLDGLAAVFQGTTMAVSLLTVGVGFMLHELAHKVLAVRYGQVAEFRASYEMLLLAVLSAMVGFLFAAPGAVHHRGRITAREQGLIALAGPVTNLALLVPFGALSLFGGLVGVVGFYGFYVNAILGAFNLIPIGGIDGKTVRAWNPTVHAAVFAVALAIGAVAFLGIFPDPDLLA